MRAYRKRAWSSLIVNMTPMIDVVFLLIIFFLMVINFSEILFKEVTLPLADEAKERKEYYLKDIPITVKSAKLIFLGNKRVSLDTLEQQLRLKVVYPQNSTVELRGDEDLPYDIVQKVMQRIAYAGITRIEFSTRQETVLPPEKSIHHETAY